MVFPLAAKRTLFALVATFFIFLQPHPALALFFGFLFSLLLGSANIPGQAKFTKNILGACVMGIAAGVDLNILTAFGVKSLLYIMAAVLCSLCLGFLFARLFKIDQILTWLITVGTAICGGSAIMAIAPIIRAEHRDISIAIAIVFLLNALAIAIFPEIGHLLSMNEIDFGTWAAVAIHDTASVIGAAMAYGPEAVQSATTVKLVRTLFIIPCVLVMTGIIYKNKAATDKPGVPWFVQGFCLILILNYLFPTLAPYGRELATIAKKMVVLALFLIGASMKRETLRSISPRPFLYAFALWITLSTLYLFVIIA